MKVKSLVAGVVLALGASVASAASVTTGDLYLEIWNGSNANPGGESFLADTGVSVAAFLANPNALDNFSVSGLDASFFTGAATWTLRGADLALDTLGSGAPGEALVTVPATNTTFSTKVTGGLAAFSDISPIAAHITGATTGIIPIGATGYAVDGPIGPNANLLGNFGSFNAAFGTSMPIYALLTDGTDFTTLTWDPSVAKPLHTFTLTANATAGSASFATAAAVPVPGAIWLLGSALAGMATVSRRGKKAA